MNGSRNWPPSCPTPAWPTSLLARPTSSSGRRRVCEVWAHQPTGWCAPSATGPCPRSRSCESRFWRGRRARCGSACRRDLDAVRVRSDRNSMPNTLVFRAVVTPPWRSPASSPARWTLHPASRLSNGICSATAQSRRSWPSSTWLIDTGRAGKSRCCSWHSRKVTAPRPCNLNRVQTEKRSFFETGAA